MIWFFTFKKWIDPNLQDEGINFNSLYFKNCKEHFGEKNGLEMFCNLEERIKKIMDTNIEAKTAYQVYDKDGGVAFILLIITPLMIRVHQKVCSWLSITQILWNSNISLGQTYLLVHWTYSTFSSKKKSVTRILEYLGKSNKFVGPLDEFLAITRTFLYLSELFQ